MDGESESELKDCSRSACPGGNEGNSFTLIFTTSVTDQYFWSRLRFGFKMFRNQNLKSNMQERELDLLCYLHNNVYK